MRWRWLRWLIGTIALLLVGCGASSTTVVTVVVTIPAGTPTINAAATATRATELNQLATALAPTPLPTATAPRPTNTPAASSASAKPSTTPTAVPTVALKVVDQGFGQNGRGIGFAFIVENPDPKLAVDFSQYRISAFDAAGQVMRTEASYIPVIFPGQRIGIAGEFAIAQDARIVNVDFAVTPGRARPFEGQSPLTTDNVVLQGNPDTGEIVTGVVKNGYAQDLKNAVVYAVAYDARGVIIGGGQKNVDRVAGAGGQAPVDVTITTTTLPARVELYAAFAY